VAGAFFGISKVIPGGRLIQCVTEECGFADLAGAKKDVDVGLGEGLTQGESEVALVKNWFHITLLLYSIYR
jgi:hypothetical protein